MEETEILNYSPQKQDNLTVSSDNFSKIKNGIINSINNLTYNTDKEVIINDLKSILEIINNIEENRKEKGEDNIKRKEYENGIYEGEFRNEIREGKGKMIWNDGDRYEGEWKNDNKNGIGIYYYNNGDKYEGEFKNNAYEGKGI